MRIAYLCADFGIPIRGYKGASVHVREMVAALRALGHEVVVLSPNTGEGNDVAAGARLCEVGLDWVSEGAWRLGKVTARSRGSRLPHELRELAYNATLLRLGSKLLREVRPDAIYERYSLLNVAGVLLARQLGIPHVLEVNAPLRLERKRTTGLRLGGAAALLERKIFGATDALLTVSRALRNYVISHGARTDRAHVQANGVDTRRFRPERDGGRIRARFGIEPNAMVVGFSGSLKPWHGTDVLLESFALLSSRYRGARLLIVGEGPQGNVLRAQAAQLGIGSHVVFTGRMDHHEMADAVCAMDVAVAPYRQVPDFYFSPLKIYEYMACGRAVVASRVGEIPELIQEGGTGALSPPDDPRGLAEALSRLLDDTELRRRLGRDARKKALHHDWLSNAERVVGLMEETRNAASGLQRNVA